MWALRVTTHEGASVTRDMNKLGHTTERLTKHDISGFDKLMDGEYGLNFKGRILYNLNFIAQRIARESLRDALSAKNDPVGTALEGLLSEEELAAMFGFDTAPTYTLDKALHWMMITYIATHDITQYTESDRFGMKTRPFAWMTDLIRNPFSMVAATRACEAVLSRETQPIVTHVRCDSPTDKRWLRMMGFATTGSVERLPDGLDYELWVKS